VLPFLLSLCKVYRILPSYILFCLLNNLFIFLLAALPDIVLPVERWLRILPTVPVPSGLTLIDLNIELPRPLFI
jgi:hypothetical protein